jgi:hypothetical protein
LAGRDRLLSGPVGEGARKGPSPNSDSPNTRWARLGAWALLALVVGWNALQLRAELLPVAYLDDSSVHEQMVRFASSLLAQGRFPLTSWFPFLGAGSPQFLHYQSLPAILAGAAGLAIGPGAAFRWSLYLMLCLWPVAVYAGARLFGIGRAAAAAGAAMSPFLASVPGVGYEQHAYVWIGYGVWTQQWASFALPLAWGLSWRALDRRGNAGVAAVAVAVTIALHYETGYLALAPLPFWALTASGPWARRLRRLVVIAVGAALLTAWVIWPLIDQASWAARNEALQGTPLVKGYGAGTTLRWLAGGGLLDHGRFPIVTILMWVGLVATVLAAGRERMARALLVVFVICLLLSFGPASFGSLATLIPGGHDIFFRRFLMGVQLAAVWLAGRGAGCAGLLLWRLVRSIIGEPVVGARPRFRRGGGLSVLAALLAAVLVLAPAWRQLRSYDIANAAAISVQRLAERDQGAQLLKLVRYVRRHGGGRVYAGSPNNWGAGFTVGQVPVFKYLERLDVQEIGYTLRTASLMTGPEFRFDDSQPSDYALFGVRYLILPAGSHVPVPARFVLAAGQYSLWTVRSGGYLHAGRIVGTVGLNRTDVGARTSAILSSGLARDGNYVAVRWGGSSPLSERPPGRSSGSPGSVESVQVDLRRGRASARVSLRAPGVAVLSASFDPGWRATVDGRVVPLRMVAPALVAVSVPAGSHRVTFVFAGYGGYPWLFALSGVTLVTLLLAGALASRRSSARAAAEEEGRGLGFANPC